MVNMSSAMGAHFAIAAAEITAEVRELGPNPLRSPALALTALPVSQEEIAEAVGDEGKADLAIS